MNAFLALVRKDLYLHFSNRRAVLMSIIAPILIAAFFGSLFGSKSGSSKASPVPIAISDQDHSPLTAKISAALQADPSLAVQSLDADAALAQVKAGKLRAAIVLPAGFGEQAGRALFAGPEGKRPEITLHYDPSQAMVLPMVRGLLAQHVMQLVSADTFSGQGAPVMKDMRAQVADNTALPAEQRQELTAMFDSIARVQERSARAPQAGASSAASASAAEPGRSQGFTMSPPFSTRELEASAKADIPYNSYAHSFAGMGVQFILMMGVDIGVALLLMRRQGLWQRLRAAPLSKARLLGSRIASCTLISLIIFVLIYAVAMAAFGVRVQGSWLGFAAVLLAFSLLTASFGLLIAALGKSPEATRGLAILATLLMVMLGGAWVPSFVFPEWLQTASLFIPTRWAVDGLDAMTWRGLPFSEALAPVGVMLGFALAFGALAIARFSWEE